MSKIEIKLAKVYKATEANEDKLKTYLQEKYSPKKLFSRRKI